VENAGRKEIFCLLSVDPHHAALKTDALPKGDILAKGQLEELSFFSFFCFHLLLLSFFVIVRPPGISTRNIHITSVTTTAHHLHTGWSSQKYNVVHMFLGQP
jgi:hypothetical protein